MKETKKQSLWQTIRDNAEKYISEVNEEKIHKSIARHERKMAKIEKSSKYKKKSEKIEDVEI